MDRILIYGEVTKPRINQGYKPIVLSECVIRERYNNVQQEMVKKELDALLIYADREHGANFSYLTGFEPRFEEALLIIHRSGENFLVLGNENMKMEPHCRISVKAIHCPCFSLPYQPQEDGLTLKKCLEQAGIQDGMYIGCVGWKSFSGSKEKECIFDIPSFIIETLHVIDKRGRITNETSIFIDAQKGLRIHVNAEEIAYHEFAAGLASANVYKVMDEIEVGKTEMEIASLIVTSGQPLSVTTICATGERFTNAVVFPRMKKICLGDNISITLGLRGGLTSRSAYAVSKKEELSEREREWLKEVVFPYYRALTTWLEMIGIGVKCSEIYTEMKRVLPKEKYHWTLNPGHYTADDEWTSSPFYPESEVVLESGIILQADIIPKVSGYAGVSAEDGVVIMGENIVSELREKYPETWERLRNRKHYVEQVLGIRLKKEVFPMSDICGYVRPFLLNRELALKWVSN